MFMQQVNPVNPVKQCLPVESTGFNKLNTVHGFFQKLGGGAMGRLSEVKLMGQGQGQAWPIPTKPATS
jgi:hypothetical protein